MIEERIARIAAQKAKVSAETVPSSGVSEKNKENEVFIPDVANLNAMHYLAMRPPMRASPSKILSLGNRRYEKPPPSSSLK